MESIIFKRKIYGQMLEWKNKSEGTSALLLKGARRVGKSTIVEEFAKREYHSYILIDFSNVNEEILELFNHISDLNFFFLRLQWLTNVTLVQRKSVIVFDEVQLCPKARQAIKHLVKDGRYDYIETGSLISIKKNIQNIIIPSEERRITMHPLDFEEFLWAIGKANTFDLIKYSFDNQRPLGDAVNRAILRDFRLYMLIGGMPQAISKYLSTNNFSEVDQIKRDIIELYLDDFRRIDATGRAATIFTSIPSELSRNSMRYKVGSVIQEARPSRMGELFADMSDSLTVAFMHHADDPGVGFALHANYDYFKMYIADTGLFVTLAFMDKRYRDNDIYRKLLSDKLPADLGYVYENAVAQMLRASGHSLFYHTFSEKSDTGTATRRYEIDFLITRGDKVCPLEVKSSGYKTHKSLDMFREKYSSRIARPYILYTKDLRNESGITYLPVYMASLL